MSFDGNNNNPFGQPQQPNNQGYNPYGQPQQPNNQGYNPYGQPQQPNNQGYNPYGQPQQPYNQGYNPYGQPQQPYNQGYNPYGQPQQPQQTINQTYNPNTQQEQPNYGQPAFGQSFGQPAFGQSQQQPEEKSVKSEPYGQSVYGQGTVEPAQPLEQPAPFEHVQVGQPVFDSIQNNPAKESQPAVDLASNPFRVPTTPVAPAEEPAVTAEEPVAPAVEPVAPVVEPVAPAVEPVAPAPSGLDYGATVLAETIMDGPSPFSKPVEPVAPPVEEPVAPVEEEPVAPVEEPAGPSFETEEEITGYEAPEQDNQFGSYEAPEQDNQFGGYGAPEQDNQFGGYGAPEQNNQFGGYGAPEQNNQFGGYGTPEQNNQFAPYGTNSPSYNPQAFSPYQAPEKEANGCAVAGMIMGICSLTGCLSFLSVPGLVCSAIGLKKKKKKGMAIAGLITSILGLIIFIFVCMNIKVKDFHLTGLDGKPIIVSDGNTETETETDTNDSSEPASEPVVDPTDEPTPEPTEEPTPEPTAPPVDENALDEIDCVHFKINGAELVIDEFTPADVEAALGITLDSESKDYILNKNEYVLVTYSLNDDYDRMIFSFANYEDEARPVSECTLYKVKVVDMGYLDKETLDCVTYDLGGGIVPGSTDQVILDKLGEPDYQYTDDGDYGYTSYQFYKVFDRKYEIDIMYYDDGVCQFEIGHY